MASLKTWLLGPSETEVAQRGLVRLREIYAWFDARPDRLAAAFRALDGDHSIAMSLSARQLKIDASLEGQGPRVGYDAGGLAIADQLLAGEKSAHAEQLTHAGAYRTLLLSFHVSPATAAKLEETYRALVRELVTQLRKYPDLIRGTCGNLLALIAQDLAAAGRGVTAIPLTRALKDAAETLHAEQRAEERARMVEPPPPPPPRPLAPLSAVQLFTFVCREVCQDGMLEDREKLVLKHLQQLLRIEPGDAARLFQEAKAAFAAGQLPASGPLDGDRTFQHACRLAWADSVMQEGELELLKALGMLLRIDGTRARQILEDERPD